MPGGNYEDKLTAAEHATLWSQYVNDSLAVCILRHFLNHVKDKEIRKVLEFALKLSESHIKKLMGFYQKRISQFQLVSLTKMLMCMHRYYLLIFLWGCTYTLWQYMGGQDIQVP